MIKVERRQEQFKKDIEPWSAFFDEVEPSVSLCMAAKTTEKPTQGDDHSKYLQLYTVVLFSKEMIIFTDLIWDH